MREDLLPRWDIHEDHLDEAAFLWMRWEQCLVAPHFDLAETAELEARLLAHLEGLADGGAPVAARLLRPALESEEHERICAAAHALLAGGGEPALEELLNLWEEATPEQGGAFRRVLEVNAWPGYVRHMQSLLASDEPALLATALAVLAFHRLVPAQALPALLEHEAADVRVAALQCARVLPESVSSEQLRTALSSSHAGIRQAAVELGLVRGSRAAWSACRELAQAGHREACVLLAVGGADEELRLLLGLLGDDRKRAAALWALGFSGRTAAADACLELMEEPPLLAALAAEAFSAITGLHVQGPYAAEAPEEEQLPSLEEDLETDLTPKPEDDLPLPVPAAIERWWQQERKRFDAGQRYMGGLLLEEGHMVEALVRTPMRRRHVLALELAIRTRGAHQLQTRALTQRQYAEWHRLQAARPSIPMLPFQRLLTWS